MVYGEPWRSAPFRDHLRFLPFCTEEFVERVAVPARAGHREADEVLVPLAEPDVQPVTRKDAEELRAPDASPFLSHRTYLPARVERNVSPLSCEKSVRSERKWIAAGGNEGRACGPGG